MDSNISNELEKLQSSQFSTDDQKNEFIHASEEYNDLVKNGLAIKRGFNIMTIQEIYNPVLNCSFKQVGHR